MDSLSDRLKSLGFRPAISLEKKDGLVKRTLEEAIDGYEVTNSAGSFVKKVQLFPNNYQHGLVSLAGELDTEKIQQSARIEFSPDALDRMLFIDTETSGLSGGTGTFAFLVGIGAFQKEGFFLQQLVIRDPSEELAMLLHLADLVGPDTIFVSFNGKSFDIPLIQNRFILNKLPARLRELAHVDILHISRRLWRRTLPSCTLKELEISVLDFNRTSEDVPGWMIPDIYYEFLRTHNPEKLSDVIYHNAQDIVSLAALMIHISRLLVVDESVNDISTNDLIAISRLYWDLGSFEISAGIIDRCLTRNLNSEQLRSVNSFAGKYFKMNKDWEKAVSHWNTAALNGDPYSTIELAKYYEHRKRDTKAALEWCESCLTILKKDKGMTIPIGFRKDLDKRILRLRGKV